MVEFNGTVHEEYENLDYCIYCLVACIFTCYKAHPTDSRFNTCSQTRQEL